MSGERRELPLPQIPDPITLSDIHVQPRNPHGANLTIPSSLVSPTTSSGNVTPVSPMNPSEQKPPKKANPLVDLIDTEKVYVDLLGGIIRVSAIFQLNSL
jgi:hypothetical protein